MSRIQQPPTQPQEQKHGPIGHQLDIAPLETDFILFPTSAGRYRLILRAVSDPFPRLIDISSPMRKMTQPIEAVKCKHKSPPELLTLTANESLHTYTLGEIIGKWGSVDEPNPTPGHVGEFARMYHVSYVLTSYLEGNLALGLSESNVLIVSHDSVCLSCAIDHARASEATNGIDNVERDRWIVFVRSDEKARQKTITI